MRDRAVVCAGRGAERSAHEVPGARDPGRALGRRRRLAVGPTRWQNVGPMQIESRDSVSLKPVELDEFSQLLATVGLASMDDHLEGQVEKFPLIVLASVDDERHGFLFGSLERVGGTPCVLWGLGAVRKGRASGTTIKGMVAELYRRAAISFPDEDVLVAGRIAHPAAYGTSSSRPPRRRATCRCAR